MKRVIAAATLTLAGLAAILGFKTRALPAAAPTDTTADLSSPTSTTAPGGASIPQASTTITPVPTTTAAGTGTVTMDGPVVDTRYGAVQVSVVITDGVLVDVVALQLPDRDLRDQQITTFAEPLLREAALRAQSADIDVVSGATFTSQGYAASLQGALDAAGF